MCWQGPDRIKSTKVSSGEKNKFYVPDNEADDAEIEHLLPKSQVAHLNMFRSPNVCSEMPQDPRPAGRNTVDRALSQIFDYGIKIYPSAV